MSNYKWQCAKCDSENGQHRRTCWKCGARSSTSSPHTASTSIKSNDGNIVSAILRKIALYSFAGWVTLTVIEWVWDRDTEKNQNYSESQQRSPKEPRRVGQPFRTKVVEMEVSNATTTDYVGQKDLELLKVSEGGIYVVLQYKYRNISETPLSFTAKPKIQLKSSTGVSYNPDTHASLVYGLEKNLDEKIISDLNPGISVSGAAVFEVSRVSFDRSTWKVYIRTDQETMLDF